MKRRKTEFHPSQMLTAETAPFTLWVSDLHMAKAPLIIVGWFAGRSGKTTINGIPKHLNYCIIFIVHT